MSRGLRAVAGGLVLAAAAITGVGFAAEEEKPPAFDSVAALVFDAGLLDNVEVPSTLHYRYEIKGRDIEEPFISSATMALAPAADGGDGMEASFEMFEGPNLRKFGPISAASQNPMVLVFLQQDVTKMGRLTGGAPGYFQQGLRHGFRQPAEVETIEVELDGAPLSVSKIVMRPFVHDPHISRFPKFRDKVYSFWVAEELPGGVFRMETETPDVETGELILSESFTFERAE